MTYNQPNLNDAPSFPKRLQQYDIECILRSGGGNKIVQIRIKVTENERQVNDHYQNKNVAKLKGQTKLEVVAISLGQKVKGLKHINDHIQFISA